jgi:hypothetical protein
MRGHLVGVDPVLAAVLYSLQQVQEDARRWTGGLTDEEIWLSEGDIASVGWQIRHLAGSIDRLTTYADGRMLTEQQFADLHAERETGVPLATLLQTLDASLVRAESVIRTTSPADFETRRYIGRKQIPTTVSGLLIHIAEHSQRHMGELIVAAKLVRLRRQELKD